MGLEAPQALQLHGQDVPGHLPERRFEGCRDGDHLLLEPGLQAVGKLILDAPAFRQCLQDGHARSSEDVAHPRRQGDAGFGQGSLDLVADRGPRLDELSAAPGQLSSIPEFGGRNEAAPDPAMPDLFGDPARVLPVCLLPPEGLDL